VHGWQPLENRGQRAAQVDLDRLAVHRIEHQYLGFGVPVEVVPDSGRDGARRPGRNAPGTGKGDPRGGLFARHDDAPKIPRAHLYPG
jgi:hypothetical protein